MANMKRAARRALAGFGLAALSMPVGPGVFAAEAASAPAFVDREATAAPAAGEVRGEVSALADLGGAIYSPFSPAPGTLAARSAAQVPVALPARDEARAGLVVTTVTAFIAVGALFVLVRILMVS